MTKYEIFSVVISLLSMVISILTACTEFRQKIHIYNMKYDAVVLPVEQYQTSSPSDFVKLLNDECGVDAEILDSEFINGQLYYGVTYSHDVIISNIIISENIYKYCNRVFPTKQGRQKGVKIQLNRGK